MLSGRRDHSKLLFQATLDDIFAMITGHPPRGGCGPLLGDCGGLV